MAHILNYQTSHARYQERQRQRAAPEHSSVVWNLCGLGASIIVVLLSRLPNGIGASMILVSIPLGALQVFVVGGFTFMGISADSVRLSQTIGMLASWLFGIGMYWLALCNGWNALSRVFC